MSFYTVFESRVRALFGRVRLERDLDDEVRFHLEMQIDDNIRAGMSPDAARAAAMRQFGGRDQLKELYRERRALPLVETMAQDVRYALRMTRRSPAFTAVAVLSLAVGIGANTAVFSFADAILLRPLAVPEPGGVLTIGLTDQSLNNVLTTSYRDYVDIRDRSRSFSGVVGFTKPAVSFAPERGGVARLAIGMLVTGNFFRVIGITPQLGRDFQPDEDEVPGRDAVVILGHDFWTQQFGADRSILGRTVRLNEIDFTVIGVAPEGFKGLDQFTGFQFYAPLMMWPRLVEGPEINPFESRDFRKLLVAGRLAPGVTMADAQSELSVIAADLERAYPEANRHRRIVVRTELQNRVALQPPSAWLVALLALLAAAVLSVSCANVAGLIASRAPMRAREIAMRLAIGASRRRVVRQLLTESVLLALAGGLLGLVVGYAGTSLFRQFRIPTDLPIVATFQIDRRALMLSLIVSLASAVLFGLAPAVSGTRRDLTTAMKTADTVGFTRRRGRAVLVAGQVAVSVVLLVVAAFVYRGFTQQIGEGPGFRLDHLLLMNVLPNRLRYDEAARQRLFERFLDQARATPGVRAAALTQHMPMDGQAPALLIVPEGFQFPPGTESAVEMTSIVSDGYFDTIGVPIVKGRAFRPTDAADAPRVAVVNDVFAQKYWPGQDAIGKRMRVDGPRGPWAEIVGVAKATKYVFIIEPPKAFIYLPFRQRPLQGLFLLAASDGDPARLATPLREVVRNLDRDLPVSNVRTLEELYRSRSIVILNVVMETIGGMGMMGLGLALVGLYSLVSYAVSRRTREIGIRMAIGAGRWDVVSMVLRQGMILAGLGLGLGLLISVAVARGMLVLFPGGPGGDGRTDLMAFPIVGVAVLIVTLLAAFIPARRASRVNPTDALRCE